MRYVKDFFCYVFPSPDFRPLAIIFTVAVIVLLILLIVPRFKAHRANLVLSITIISLLLMVIVVSIAYRWVWVVGLLPTLMVGYQLFILWLYQPREIGNRAGAIPVEVAPQTGSQKQTHLETKKKSYKRAQDTISNHFRLRTLFIRYGLPAVLLGITGILISYILVEPYGFFPTSVTSGANFPKILTGVRLGAVGAYVYILLELGRRTFRHDITGAVAMWCWVTLVLGPVLAATVAYLWISPPEDTNVNWAHSVVLFFAGFAPRRVIAAIEQAAAQLLKIGTPTVLETRLIPLSKIRGISPQIEERLGEEGILDVNSLAAVEPIRLVRNTTFDMRQILIWIDEAILIVTLPRGWEGLEEEGITGAMDLVWYYDQVINPQDGSPIDPIPTHIRELAKKANFADPANFVSTIRRLYEDTQVQYIWSLYNNFTEFSGPDQLQADASSQLLSRPEPAV